MNRKGAAAVAVLVVLVAGGVLLYRSPLSRINFAGSLGAGGRAEVQVPPDFTIEVFAEGLDGPRFIAFGPDETLYVAERGAGRIVALPDADGDGRTDAIRPLCDSRGP